MARLPRRRRSHVRDDYRYRQKGAEDAGEVQQIPEPNEETDQSFEESEQDLKIVENPNAPKSDKADQSYIKQHTILKAFDHEIKRISEKRKNKDKLKMLQKTRVFGEEDSNSQESQTDVRMSHAGPPQRAAHPYQQRPVTQIFKIHKVARATTPEER